MRYIMTIERVRYGFYVLCYGFTKQGKAKRPFIPDRWFSRYTGGIEPPRYPVPAIWTKVSFGRVAVAIRQKDKWKVWLRQ